MVLFGSFTARGTAKPPAERKEWPAVSHGGGPGGHEWTHEETQSLCCPGTLTLYCTPDPSQHTEPLAFVHNSIQQTAYKNIASNIISESLFAQTQKNINK